MLQVPIADTFLRTVGQALLYLVLFAVVFLFVPQWVIIDVSVASRDTRIGLAMGWAILAFCGFCYLATRISSTEHSEDPSG